jgi:diguanylate cyclase (GGDEF)-like protein
MSFIDPRTIVLLASVMSGLMSLVLYSLKRNYPASIKGLGNWSAALLLIFIGAVLAAGNVNSSSDRLPQLLTISLPRLLIASGLYLSYVGTQRFFGVKPELKRWSALIALMTVLQMWFTFVNPNFHVRLVMANLLAGLLFGMQAHLLLKQGPFTFAKVLTTTVVVIMVGTQIMRLVTSFVLPLGNDIFNTAPHHQFYVTSFVLCVFLFSIGTVLMATDRLRTELEHLATHDSLTNAFNRRYMNEACNKELERCRRHGRSMALIMIDLDHFKAINDSYGHQAGDQVLVNFVIKVNALLRQPDLLGRFGGEEFVVLLPETSQEEALIVAERIREVCILYKHQPSCTVSMGVATNNHDSDTVDTLMSRADAALYRAKSNGRNRVEAA